MCSLENWGKLLPFLHWFLVSSVVTWVGLLWQLVLGHSLGGCPLVLHLEQYGDSGQFLFRCAGLLQRKHSLSSLGLSWWSLCFTHSPLADFEMCCLGELGVCCIFVAGINCFTTGLIFESKHGGCEFLVV